MARLIPLLLLILSAIPANASTATEAIQLSRFGAVPVFRPAGEPAQVALLLSEDQGLAQAVSGS